MTEKLEARAAALVGRRAAAVRDALAGADLPPGITARHEGDTIVFGGRDLVRRLAFDSRLAAIALTARGA